MKNEMENKVLTVVSKLAMGTAKKTANSACVFLGYQPKLPQSVNKLKKF
ncbi:cyclic lactone autoinducer peptide [Anaerocolumna sp. AGMB13025]|nr:cyclic lactone autoinducer peptide [Anaerocolumna sp. AGMB13025]WFR59866.1 cyclic lactone autoinducer peptide [Anaerocolumna sp. AGMB13025]